MAFDSTTGAPINLASVVCSSNSFNMSNLATDSKGILVVGALEADFYTCTVTAPGYYPNSAAHVVTPAGKVNIPQRVPMEPLLLGTVSGYVRHAVSKGYLRGSNVTCRSATYERDIIVNAGGYFELHDLPSGSYTCTGSLRGFQSAGVAVTIASGTNPFITVLLNPLPAVISLSVVDWATGDAVANVTVSCSECVVGTSLGTQTSDSNGNVVFGGINAEIARNSFTCTFSAPSYITMSDQYEVQRGELTGGVFALKKM